MLKSYGWVEPESMWWSQSLCGGLQHFSVSPRPLLSLLRLAWGWAYGVWGLRVWGQGLTIKYLYQFTMISVLKTNSYQTRRSILCSDCTTKYVLL